MLRTAFAAVCLTLTLWTVSGAAAQPGAGRVALAVSVVGDGKILSSDARIDCGSQCSASYRRGSIRQLTATPSEGFNFVKWDGDCIGTAPICDLALDRGQQATASFAGKDELLLLSVGGPGRIVSPQFSIDCGTSNSGCGAVVTHGTTVTLTPEPAADGSFAGWDGPCAAAGTGPCTVAVRGLVEITAAFGHASPLPGDQPLDATALEYAHITSQPAGIDCPPTCSASFLSGTLVTLTRNEISQWTSGCWGALPRCRVVVDAPTHIAATTPPPPPLAPLRPDMPPPPPVVGFVDATVSGKGLVTGSRMKCGRAPNPRRACSDFISPGGIYTLRATHRKGTYFARWGGACRGKKTTCRITMSGGGLPSYSVTGLFRVTRR